MIFRSAYRFISSLYLLILMVGIVGLATPAAAQIGLGSAPLKLCIKPIASGDVPDRLFRSPAAFDCSTAQTEFGRGDFWVLASHMPNSARATTPLSVRTAAIWQRHSTLYARFADGAIVALPLGRSDISRHLQLGAIVEQAIPARPAPLVQLLWKIEGASNLRGIVVGAQTATSEESARNNLFMAALYAAFGGLCIALLVHNLAMWRAMKHDFQIIYCLMVVTLMIYTLSSSGALAWLWPSMPDMDRIRINYLMLSSSASLALLFARSYFEPRVFAGWIGVATRLVTVLLMTSGVSFALLVPWQALALHKFFAFSFLAMVALIPAVLWRAWRAKSSYLRVFAITWAAPIIFAGLRVANSLNLLNWSFWVDNSTILAMTSEALLSSLAISYRIRMLSRERDDARVQELAARALADTDPLTGLLNRRSFLDRAIGRDGEHVLMIADLDHFKAVNETIGHDGGDEVLRVFARSLRASLPAEALVARIGGEEFAIVLPAGTPIEANAILDRLRAERMPFDLTVTASIGTSTGPLTSEIDWKKLYRRADRALFAAKTEGRDCARHNMALAA